MERYQVMMCIWAAAGVAAFLITRVDSALLALAAGCVLLGALLAESYTYVTGG